MQVRQAHALVCTFLDRLEHISIALGEAWWYFALKNV